jgi:formylglycine-generating enzyme required for sulfatase activity
MSTATKILADTIANVPSPAPTITETPTQTPSPQLGIGSTQISEKDGMTLLYVPAGKFQMGSDIAVSTMMKPMHAVYLDAFWIDRTLVTNDMYAKCTDSGSCKAPSDYSSATRKSYYGNSQFGDYPVVYVNWNQAVAYCKWADRKLPTEAQWEKAARSTDARNYPWGEGINQQNADYNGIDTIKVGSFPAGISPYGAQDMAGNVWEWVADWYDPYYYVHSPEQNPPGPLYGIKRVIRGGWWFGSQVNLQTWFRGWASPDAASNTYGFRCSISVPSSN